MFGFQTFACLHEIPIIRSSTDKLQDVYAKAKDKTVLIRYPCNLAERFADKSIRIAVTVANPLIKPLEGPVRLIDDFTVKKIRQIEAKYPVINTSTDQVVNSFNEKTEPVRNVINSVRDSTTSTIQQGKDKVSDVANATVNKATDVADTVYTFCETYVPGKTVPVHRYDFGRRTSLLWERILTTVRTKFDFILKPIEVFFIWFQMSFVSFLLGIKQINDVFLNKIPNKSFQRLLIYTGQILEYFISRLRPTNETKQNKQQFRTVQKKQQFVSRPTLKPGAFVTTSQSIVVTKQDTILTRNENSKTPIVQKEFNDNFDQFFSQEKSTNFQSRLLDDFS